jgi:hypothetical protein
MVDEHYHIRAHIYDRPQAVVVRRRAALRVSG